jgi:hypothetical protein
MKRNHSFLIFLVFHFLFLVCVVSDLKIQPLRSPPSTAMFHALRMLNLDPWTLFLCRFYPWLSIRSAAVSRGQPRHQHWHRQVSPASTKETLKLTSESATFWRKEATNLNQKDHKNCFPCEVAVGYATEKGTKHSGTQTFVCSLCLQHPNPCTHLSRATFPRTSHRYIGNLFICDDHKIVEFFHHGNFKWPVMFPGESSPPAIIPANATLWNTLRTYVDKAKGPRPKVGSVWKKVQAQAGPNTGQYCNATCWKEIPLLPVMSIWVRKNYLAASPYPCGYVHRVALAKRVPIFSHILWFHLTLVSWMLWCSLHDHLPPVQPQILIPSISNFLKGTKFGHFDFPITRHDDMCLGVHTMFTHNAHAAHSWQNHFTPPQSNQSFVHTNAM